MNGNASICGHICDDDLDGEDYLFMLKKTREVKKSEIDIFDIYMLRLMILKLLYILEGKKRMANT